MMRFFFILLPAFLLINSCQTLKKETVKEGIIEYEIEYLDPSKETLYSFFLPKKMITHFKENKTSHTIESFSGNFMFKIIIDNQYDNLVVLCKLFTKNQFYMDDKTGPSELFGIYPGFNITFSDDTAVIAGYTCKKATVVTNDSIIKSYNVYYTKQIKAYKPNRKNMYFEIEGTLLDFYATLFNMNMRMKAVKILETEVPDSEFEIPANYERINREGLLKITSILE